MMSREDIGDRPVTTLSRDWAAKILGEGGEISYDATF